jgi:hypothetical protein
MFKAMYKSLLTTILLFIFLSAKSQDFTVNELIDLKSGDVELFKKKYVGKGWSAPRRKLFQRKRKDLFVAYGINGEKILSDVNPFSILEYFPSKTNGFDSFIRIIYPKGEEKPEAISWTFKSEKSFIKLMNSIKSVKFDKEWIDTVKIEGRTLFYFFEKDDINVKIIDSRMDTFLNPYYPRFCIEISHNFTRLFDLVLSNSELLKAKSANLFGPFIYYKELKIGGEVREVDEDFLNEKIPRDKEYSISGQDGISVLVVDGLIVKINQRKNIYKY